MSIVINDVSPRVHYTATAGQTVFTVPFAWILNSHLKVWVNGVLATFAAPPDNASQYSTTGEGTSAGGSITFGAPGRVAGDKVVIIRDMPIARVTDLPTSGVFPVESLNEHLDASIAMVQQTEVNVQQRTLRLVDHDEMPSINPLPLKAARVNRMLSFDANGHPSTAVGLQEFLDAINGARDDALEDIQEALDGALDQMQDLVDQAEAAADEAEGWASAAQLIFIQDTAPAIAQHRNLWWESDSGNLFVYYNDGSSTQWVQISGGVGVPGSAGSSAPSYLRWACGDETTPISVGNAKVTDRLPYAFTATGLKASLNTAQASGAIFTVDFKWWNGSAFVTALSTLLTFDNTETSSLTAAAQPVLSKTSFADDDIIRIDVTQVGDSTAAGLKVTLLGSKT